MSKFWLVALLSLLTINVRYMLRGLRPRRPGTIQGIVTRAGTTEPLSGAQVTLQGGAVDPQAMQVLLNTAASQGIVVTPAPGASTSDIIQALADAAVARGISANHRQPSVAAGVSFRKDSTHNDHGSRRRVHV